MKNYGTEWTYHRSAHPTLAFLDAQIVKQGGKDILGANSFGDETKCVIGCPSNAFLVCLKHVKKLETDSHPFACVDALWAAICNSAHKIDRVLLHFLVPVSEDSARYQLVIC
jgi:hypothetical protein